MATEAQPEQYKNPLKSVLNKIAPSPTAQRKSLNETLEQAIINSRKIDDKSRRVKSDIRLIVGGAAASALAIGLGVWGINRALGNNEPSSQPPTNSQSVGSLPKSSNSETLQPVTRGVIQMTREEYEKIAPPEIDRTNVKEVPVTRNIPPGLDGRTTRDLTLEQGTTVSAMIYVKTPDGNIRDVTKTKITDAGGITGASPVGFTFPNCQTLLGQEGEIQAGDIFPAPITGRVYYSGSTLSRDYKGQKAGEVSINGYEIEGQYYDEKTGKTFKTIVRVRMLGSITKPLIPNLPNTMDPAFNVVDADGRVGYLPMDAKRDKMPIVTVQQGQDLFSFINKPPAQKYSSGSKPKSQIEVSTSYQGDFGENGIANTFGGENCNHPTVDNREIVLK